MKKVISLIMTTLMVLSGATMTFAEEKVNEARTIQSYSNDMQTRADGLTSWKVVSKEKVGTVTGAWQTVPKHKGPVIDTYMYCLNLMMCFRGRSEKWMRV